jgi:hypothetical protein
MEKNIFWRLKAYYLEVAKILRGEAEAASIFPNSSDKGSSRENIYLEFLKQHIPSKCNAFFGGFLFDEDGIESKQLDIIITTDTTPRFDLQNKDGKGKSFAPIEGTVGVVSVKSFLDKKELIDALKNIASIPNTRSLDDRISFTNEIREYENFPYKIIYASSGLSSSTIDGHIKDFYEENLDIPKSRMPDLIHVSGMYVFIKIKPGMVQKNKFTGIETDISESTYYIMNDDPDLFGILNAVISLQDFAMASQAISHYYGWIANKIYMT